MLRKIENIFSIPDLRKRIFMTLALLAVFRLGVHVPTPGIDADALTRFFENSGGNLLGFLDMFTGGALKKLTVFGLGVMPYISASIILELLTVVIPHLGELKKRGTEGREKITRYTRYFTVFISFFQGFAIAIGLEGMNVAMQSGWGFRLITALTLTTGTIFLMWLGEKITSFGIGNGMSLLIMAGIIAALPAAITQTWTLVRLSQIQIIPLLIALVVMAAAFLAIVFMETSQRRLPIQYVRKGTIGARSQTVTSYLPLKLNPAGVIPIIFASTIVTLPPTLATFVKTPITERIGSFFDPSNWPYYLLSTVFIVFFTYFYTSIIFNPNDIAENIQKSGGVIPGKRPGAATADFIDYVLSRLTFVGSIYLALVAILPQIIISWFNMPFYFGGTSVLIVVGVGLDVIQKIEAHLITNNYDGFLKQGRIRGRYH
ncbi:MAG: preprotein translocase subunit SecY [Deferribacteraceae bacterium]|jgi:preprotein translocase subunit SecY|nr:preprotein translocase subunit SecY [Deferribacteraceae bacterium]